MHVYEYLHEKSTRFSGQMPAAQVACRHPTGNVLGLQSLLPSHAVLSRPLSRSLSLCMSVCLYVLVHAP
jgi:hypothetical protein